MVKARLIGRSTTSGMDKVRAIIMCRSSDAARAEPGNIIRLSHIHDAKSAVALEHQDLLRPGQLIVSGVDPLSGHIYVDRPIREAIPAACHDDYVFVQETPSEHALDHHAALVAYLLSAAQRQDWHAVSDAANDLRVLEARAGRG